MQLNLPSVVTITANQHFAVNRWNPNYSGTQNKPAAAAASGEKAASTEAKGGDAGGGGGGAKGEAAQGIFSSVTPLFGLEPDLHWRENIKLKVTSLKSLSTSKVTVLEEFTLARQWKFGLNLVFLCPLK